MTAPQIWDPDAAFKTAFREAMAEIADPPAVTLVSPEELAAEAGAEAGI
jgi:hypothetical protein